MSPTPQADRAGSISLPLWPAYICFLLIFTRENEWRLQTYPRGLKEKRNKTEGNMAMQKLAPRRAAAPELVAMLLSQHPCGSRGLQGTWGQILLCSQSRGAGDCHSSPIQELLQPREGREVSHKGGDQQETVQKGGYN